MNLIRQGDVLITPVSSLPAGSAEIPNDNGRIVLAYGEVTGHAHAIADHIKPLFAEVTGLNALGAPDCPVTGFQSLQSQEISNAAIARAQTKARLWQAPDGNRYLEVSETVHLTHEEHTAHALLPGIYQLPTQVEYTPEALRQVAD